MDVLIGLVVVSALLFGIASSIVGSRKGMAGSGFALGALLGPIGLIIVLVSAGNRIQCPACRELIHADAIKCRHCGVAIEKPLPGPQIICDQCGTRYPAEDSGCSWCGKAKPRMA